MTFYSYGQIIRNKIPEGLSNFYILHEGPIATLDDELMRKIMMIFKTKNFQNFSKRLVGSWR